MDNIKRLSDLPIEKGEFYAVKTYPTAEKSYVAFVKDPETTFGIQLEFLTGAEANCLYEPILLSFEEAKKRIETTLKEREDEFIKEFHKERFN